MSKATQVLRTLWRLLGSTSLAAILLAVLLLAVLLAGLLPQIPAPSAARETWLAAARLRYGSATGLLYAAGLFDVYHASWFLALLATLLLNALICTLQHLPRLWRILTEPPQVARPEAFYQGFAQRSEWPVSSLQAGLVAAQRALAHQRFHTRFERDEGAGHASLYAERGRWAQIGTAFSHLALLVLLVAVLARPALSWSVDGVLLFPGRPSPLPQRAGTSIQTGPLTIERHPGGQPRDYRVPLTVLVEASPVLSRTVRINHPLAFRGTAFHLQSHGPAVRVAAPEGTFDLAFTGSQAGQLELPQAGLILRIAYQPAQDPQSGAEQDAFFVEVMAAGGALFGSGTVTDGQEILIQGTPITFTSSHYTAWQISHDPTFDLAVAAAGFLLVGMVLSLWVPHRRLWLRVDAESMRLVGAGEFNGQFEALVGHIAAEIGAEDLSDGQ
jgi:cytochrome c biogenesis protein